MFDARLRPLIDPPLNVAGRWLARHGVSANSATILGMLIGIGAAYAVAQGLFYVGLALILVNRIIDGLDGAIARASTLTDFGGYLDIVGDFVFYVAIPVGFALVATQNQLPALILAAAFALTGTSFLAFATLAAKRGVETSAHGRKSFFYNTGLAEGGETIAVFVLMCIFPSHFGPIAYGYAALCVLTVIQRTIAVKTVFAADGSGK